MDKHLQERLTKWHQAIEELAEYEKIFLTLESHEDPMFSAFFLQSPGKGVAEKEAQAYVQKDWAAFQEGLVEAKVQYNKKKRELDLKQAAFNAEYLEKKIHGEAIQRMPRGIT